MRPALRRVVFSAHLFALVLEQFECSLPVQCLLLLGAVVEKVHAQADINAHCLEALLSGLSVDDIIAHVESGLQIVAC